MRKIPIFFHFSKNENFNNKNVSYKKIQKNLVDEDILLQNQKSVDFEKNIFKRVNISKNPLLFSSLDITKNVVSRKKNFPFSFFSIDTFAFFQNFCFESFWLNQSMYSKKLNKKQKMKNYFFDTLNISKNNKFDTKFLQNSPKHFHFFLEKKNLNFRKTEGFSSCSDIQKNLLFSDNLSYQNFEKFSTSNVFSQNYSNSEFYATEIFWIPQENYTVSNIDIFSFLFREKIKNSKIGIFNILKKRTTKTKFVLVENFFKKCTIILFDKSTRKKNSFLFSNSWNIEFFYFSK